MAKEYKVIVNDQEVDLYKSKDLDLAITLAISDSNNITVRKKANTKTLKFPGTGNNKVIFGHPEDPNSIVNLDQQSKPSVIIEADGTEIFRGYIKVVAATDIGNKVIEYEGLCTGTNGDWIQRMGNDSMNTLDYSDQNHTNDWQTIMTSEFANASIEYVYDLIDRGEFTGQLYDGNTKRGVNIQDRFPALKIKGMVERTFKSIGYTVSSSFFSSTFFTKLYWMFTNEELKHPDSFNADLVAKVQSNTVQKVTPNPQQQIHFKMLLQSPRTIFYNTSGAFEFNTGSEYFCLGKGKHTFSITVNFTAQTFGYYDAAQTNNGNVIFTFKKRNRFKDGNAYVAGLNATSQITTLLTNTHSAIINFEREFDLEFGDEVYLDATMFYKQIIGGSGGEHLKINQYIFECVKVEGSLGMGENQYVDWAYNLPDVPKLEFIQGLKDLFNLHFTADTNKRVVYIEPRDDFYNGDTQDWSDKLDNAKEIKASFLGDKLAKTLRYRYKDDPNDKVVDLWNKQNNKIFGAEDSDINNVFAKDEIQEIENTLFAPTWMEDCPRIGLVGAIIPKMWNSTTLPKRSQKFLPRILYYNGLQTVPNGGYWRFNKLGTIAYQNANPITTPFGGKRLVYPNFYSFDDSQVNDNNLMYDDRYYSSGLHQKYFRNAQKILDEGRQFDMYIYLNDTDISNIDFRQPIYIERDGNGAYFILDKVSNYKSQDNVSTLCTLTKIIPTTPFKVLRYNTNKPKPIFTVAGDSGDGLIVTTTGSVVGGGQPYTNKAPGGSIMQHGGGVVINESGSVRDVYFTDSDGKLQRVIMNTNK